MAKAKTRNDQRKLNKKTPHARAKASKVEQKIQSGFYT
jgi:hypothetical protein